MKRINHGLIVGLAVLLLAALSFIGCESPTEAEVVVGPPGKDGTGTPGTPGTPGNPGRVYLEGTYTSAAIQAAIDSGAPLTFTKVIQSEAAVIVIPPGRNVNLIGPAAITVFGSGDPSDDGILVIGAVTSITGNGTIVGSAVDAIVVAPESVYVDTASVVKYTIVDSMAAVATAPAATVAYAGNRKFVAAATTTAGEITVPAAAIDVFIIGDLDATVASTSTNIHVLGNLTTSVTGAPVTGGTLNVKGNATFSGAVASVGGAATIGGTLNATGATSFTATGGVTVNGAATFNGTFAGGASTFNGPVAFKGDITQTAALDFNDTVTITNGKKITVGGAVAITLKNGKAIRNTSGVDLLKAGLSAPVVLTGTSTEVLTFNAADLTVTTAGFAVTSGELIVAKKLDVSGSGVVATVSSNAKLTLAKDAVLATGSGSVVAGQTTFNTAGTWTAKNQAISISPATNVTTIASVAAGGELTAAGTPKITQAGAASTNLIINPGTTIDLGGNAAAVGTIQLVRHATPGTITFPANSLTAVIKTGNTGSTAVTGAAGNFEASGLTTNSTAVSVSNYTNVVITGAGSGAAAKLVKITGSATGGTLKASTDTTAGDCLISGNTNTTAP
ncbi:hypothetical protein AGMMS49942_16280 [Spirochaetia bacterium]|nr:hypothetical protein AGMMS49942_16280 [Spirochaetia bacterium]